MSDNPHANGGTLLKDLRLPDFRNYGVDVAAPGASVAEATKVLGHWLTEVVRRNPDVPTLEALAAVDLLKQNLPDLKIRFVNVVD